MPAKVYLDSPPHGDFRAMPARGDGLALLKWVTSFPGNSARGLPVVRGEVLLSDAETGEELAVIECSSVTSLRTGAAAAVSAQALAARGRELGGDRRLWGERRLGGPLPGGGRLRARGLRRRSAGGGRRRWPRSSAGGSATAPRRPRRTSWSTVTPGDEPVILASDLRPGQHLAVLGADAHGKQEVELEAIERCRLFCDEWEQASAGGELRTAWTPGVVDPRGGHPARRRPDRRGRGPRDSARRSPCSTRPASRSRTWRSCQAVYEGWREGAIEAPVVEL